MTSVGDRVRQEREWVGYTATQMAERLKVTEPEYEAIEDGSRAPTDRQMERLGFLLGTTPARLRGEPLRADPEMTALLDARDLTAENRYEVLRFAEFLRTSGVARLPARDTPPPPEVPAGE